MAVEEVWNLERDFAGRDTHDVLDELAELVTAGERSAFEQIYSLLADDLYAYARAHSASDADAEDIVATVFLRAWQYARRYRRGSRGYRRWVFGIARNEVRNAWRTERKVKDLLAELERTREPDPSPSAPPSIPVDEVSLERAIASLTPDQRDVIVLRYLNGKSSAEVAQLLGKAEGSIRALQYRALRQLRSAVNRAAP